jgi:Fe2+ transport system protein FeoA
MIPLAYVPEGRVVRVVAIQAGRGLYKRLYELGITEGRLLRVVKTRGPGPVIIELIHDATPFCRGWSEASPRLWCCNENIC